MNNIYSTMSQAEREAETERRVAISRDFFMQGYNCAQSVAMTFADLYDVPADLLCKLSAPFGGGIGRMRETCGAACGMFMLTGLQTPTDDSIQNAKAQTYEIVQQLAARFKEQTGSLICKELLGLNKKRLDGTLPDIPIIPTPEPRTAEYYKKRPCVKMVETAVRTYMEYLFNTCDTPAN